jgi:methylenetetrahydrofolate--tRNA-(uracil-5-)-methyltransferase
MAGINLARTLSGLPITVPPATTMLGALYRYLREANPKHFQPMNANFGLLDPLPGKVKKDRKKELLAERAQEHFADWLQRSEIVFRGATTKADHRGTENPGGLCGREAHDIA